MAVSKIWRKLPEKYNLIGKRCSRCSKLYFPARDVCRECGNYKLDDYQFKGEGSVATYSVVRTPVADPEGENYERTCVKIPYVLAVIELVEGPRLTSQVVDCKPEDVEIGKEVEVVFRKLLEKGNHGVIQYGYKFKLK